MNVMANHGASFHQANADDNFLSIGVNQAAALDAAIIEIANMATMDYVFITPDFDTDKPISDQNSLSLIFQLIEKLQLNLERTTFIAIDIDDRNKNQYSSFDVQCIDQFPLELKHTPIINNNFIDFIETLHMHASIYSF